MSEIIEKNIDVVVVEEKPATKTTEQDLKNAVVEQAATTKKVFNKKPWQKNNKNNPRDKKDSGFEEKVVAIKRISKTTKGGRSMRFSALVVVGDKNGSVGFGMGKSIEVPNAIKKAIKNARNNMVKVTMTKKGSIFHDVQGKAGAGKVLLKPAKEGTGLIAGGAIRAVIELAGYKDIYTKNLGKNTPQNMIQATMNGLKSQLTPEEVANARDKDVSNL